IIDMTMQPIRPPIEPARQSGGILSRLAGGFNKFSEELINPTSALGRLGMFLGAAGGSDLGQAQMMAAQDARLRRRDMFEDEDRQLDREYRQAQIAKMLAPKEPNDNYERIVARLGQAQGDSYLRALAE